MFRKQLAKGVALCGLGFAAIGLGMGAMESYSYRSALDRLRQDPRVVAYEQLQRAASTAYHQTRVVRQASGEAGPVAEYCNRTEWHGKTRLASLRLAGLGLGLIALGGAVYILPRRRKLEEQG